VGERLLLTVGHRFEEIETELEKPAGTIRITATDYRERRRGAYRRVDWERETRF
jgi:hypothetical protein